MRRKTAEARLAAIREGYDRSYAEAGMVLVQQSAAGADSHHVSRSVYDLLAWDPAAFLTPGTLRAIVHVEDLPAFRTCASDPSAEASVIRLRHADGSYRWFRFGVRLAAIDEPLMFSLVDVTNDAAARARRQRAQELLEQSSDAVFVLHLEHAELPATVQVADLNPAAGELIRRREVGRLDEVFGEASLNLIRNAAFDVAHTGEAIEFARLRLPEFPNAQLDAVLTRLGDGSVALRLRDVTQTAELEEHLRHRALHDHRTGLPNLGMLEDRLVELAHGEAGTVGLLAIELRMDHVDDHLVVEVARRVEGTASPGSLVARVGEARLAVLPPLLSHAEELTTLAQTAASALAIPFDIDGAAVAVRAIVGAAAAANTEAPKRLLRDAEATARRAGERDQQWAVSTEPSRVPPEGIFHQVRSSIGSGDMELRYQPIMDLRTGRVTKVEALLRWGSSTENAASALDVAQDSGLVDNLSRWVIGQAAAAASELAASPGGPRVTVNLSTFGGVDHLEGFIHLLAADGLEIPGRLEVEVSETALSDSPLRAAELVDKLRSIGLSVVIDDFGAGYTSLSTVAGLALDGLKIDRSYIATLTSIPADAAVVQSTIDFCHQLGLDVTALGVADEATLSVLRSMGCDLAQGFLLSEPLPIGQVPDRVAQLESAFV
jgi:EAL domain-containing protein (putative c-di-GMP-specific phosphodiesterase class I)/GGDEF domain-containing protein/PAS domain-containing protein